ncbi:hypothetical protein [Persephonella sp.]
MKLNRYVYNSIKKRFQSLEIKEEDIKISSSFIKKAEIFIEGKKIKGTPVSIGYRRKKTIEGRVFKIEDLTPSVIFEKSIQNKIFYINRLDKPEKLKYILPLEPQAAIINTELKRPIYIEQFPVIYIPSFLKEKEIKIDLSLKEKEEIAKNYYFDIGYGAYFLFLNFSYDSRFQKKEDIDFYGSFQVFKEIIRRLLEVKKPSGYRIRVLLSDYKYSNYLPLKEHLKKIDPDLILSVIHVENSGLGNEKLILKTDKNIIDNFHFQRIKELFESLGLPLKTGKAENFYFPNLKIPIIWFSSQPNSNKYTLKKEFLNRNLIDNFASNLFYVINNLYKEIG